MTAAVGERPESLSREQIARLQRRTVAVLSIATILGGLGVGASLSVGALLLAEVSGNDAISGLGSAMFNAGAAAAGIPLARLAIRRGRRRALVTGSLVAMVGSLVAVFGAAINQWVVLALGIALVGVASAVQLLSRFTATDLALPHNRARDLSLVVWAITVGAVVGPNLMGPGAVVGELLGVTPLAGVFVFPFFAQALAALTNLLGLRPDPLLTARALKATELAREKLTEPEAQADSNEAAAAKPSSTTTTTTTATNAPVPVPDPTSNRPQILTIFMIAMAQAIMVGLMAMTPLHLMHHEGTPELVGVTLSLHIAGMYALSPVFGILATRYGRLRVITLGWVLLLISIVIAYVSGSSHLLVQIAMILLGLGWGAVTVAAATLLTDVTKAEERPKWQGRSDTVMSASGALAGVLSGVIFALGDFSFLALLTGVLLAFGAVATLSMRFRSR